MRFSKRLTRVAIIQRIENDLDKLDSIEGFQVNKLEFKKIYLHQSYVIHLVASWQEFIEELVEYSYSALEKGSSNSIMNGIAKRRIDALIGRFNTPNAKNINSIFKDAFGILEVSNSWVFDGFNNQQALNVLNSVLLARHQIAHTGYSENPLDYHVNFENMEVIYKMACATEKYIFDSLNID